MSSEHEFRVALTKLISKHGMESYYGNTPDHVLANIAMEALSSFHSATIARDGWYGLNISSLGPTVLAAEKLMNEDKEG